MMKAIFIVIFLVFQLKTNAQTLKISEIVPMLKFSNDKLDTFLSGKGFEFETIENLEDCKRLTYEFKLSDPPEFLTKYNFNDGKLWVSYCVFDPQTYSKLKQEISAYGFVLKSQESYLGKLVLSYLKGGTYLNISSGRVEGESFTAYEITVSTQPF